MTAGPAARVAALLRLYRPVVDELFVAVDDRAGDDVVAAADEVGARVVRYPYAEPVDRPLAWLHEQCRGDWVLTIDDDEVPGAGLLAALRDLVAARDVTHYWIPRRWLHPSPATYLAEAPWQPDYQLRLVENDPRLLRFFEETHRPIEVVGPGRYLELPVYHADCVLNPFERRAEKARKYERLRPGKRVAGGAMSHVFYLPELRPAARTAAVPADDLRLVEQALAATDVPAAAPPPVPRATREEIDWLWVGRVLPESAYAARIELLDPPGRLLAGEQRALDARVSNLGGEPWPWGGLGVPELRVSYRWRDRSGTPLVADGLRTPFPAPVAPGASAVVPVHVAAPDLPGRHVLEVDLVHEHVRWFGCGVAVEVEVAAPLRVAVLAGEGARGALLERLADAAPELEPLVLAPGAAPSGYRTAPTGDAYLLGAGARSPLLAAPAVALRAARLVRAARRARAAGTPPPLPRGGGSFLAALAGARLLVLAGRAPGARSAAAAAATALAARALAVPVVLADGGPPPRGPAERVLARVVARLASDRPLERAAAEAARGTG